MMCPDNYDRWVLHQAEQDRQLEKCPDCDGCGEKIQTEHFWFADGDMLCDDCFHDWCRDNFLRYRED